MGDNTKLVPEIRFKGFTDAWCLCKLGEVADIFDGTHQTPNYTNIGVKFVSVENISNLSGTKKFISMEDYNSQFKNKATVGDIFMTRITAGIIGETAIVENDEDFAYYVSLALIKLRDGMNNAFVNYCINANSFKNELNKRIIHTAFPKKINLNEIGKCEMIYACPDEQQKIGTFFRTFESIIAKHKQKLDGLRELKKGYLQLMFPQAEKLVPQVRINGFTGNWEKQRVGNMFEVTRGQVLAATTVSEQKDENNIYPVYSSQTKNNGLLGYYHKFLFDTAVTWTTDGANAGTVTFREGKFYSTNVSGVLLSDKGFSNQCIAEALNLVAWRYVSRVGNPKIMNNIMAEIMISAPSLAEQTAISNFIRKLDDNVTMQQSKLEQLKQLKVAYLQKMFVQN